MQRINIFSLLLFVIISNTIIAQIDVEKNIPDRWEVYKILQIPAKKLQVLSTELKGEVLEMKNYFIKTVQDEIQVKKAVCGNAEEAGKIYEAMVALNGSENRCLRINNEVFELKSNNADLIEKAKLIVNTVTQRNNLKIKLSSIFVGDQDKALKFYTEILGFEKKADIPLGEFRWLTVVSPEGPADVELALEPNILEPVKIYQSKLLEMGIPINAFEVNDLQSEFERLKKLGVQFTVDPTKSVGSIMAIFNDTCGNLIQIYQVL